MELFSWHSEPVNILAEYFKNVLKFQQREDNQLKQKLKEFHFIKIYSHVHIYYTDQNLMYRMQGWNRG